MVFYRKILLDIYKKNITISNINVIIITKKYKV